MAKRFTDTDKWKKDWYLNLTLEEKVFWQFICDNCTTGGIWNVSWKSAEFHVGVKLDREIIERVFSKQFISLDDGKRWLIVDYVKFQYGKLSRTNPAHKGAWEELERYSLVAQDGSILLPDNKIVVPSKPLDSTLQGTKVMVMDKAMIMDKEEGVIGETKLPLGKNSYGEHGNVFLTELELEDWKLKGKDMWEWGIEELGRWKRNHPTVKIYHDIDKLKGWILREIEKQRRENERTKTNPSTYKKNNGQSEKRISDFSEYTESTIS